MYWGRLNPQSFLSNFWAEIRSRQVRHRQPLQLRRSRELGTKKRSMHLKLASRQDTTLPPFGTSKATAPNDSPRPGIFQGTPSPRLKPGKPASFRTAGRAPRLRGHRSIYLRILRNIPRHSVRPRKRLFHVKPEPNIGE